MAGAERNELIHVIHDAGQAENGTGYEAAADSTDGQSVWTRIVKKVIGGFSRPAPSMNWMTILGFPGMCFLRLAITALVRKLPTPPGELS